MPNKFKIIFSLKGAHESMKVFSSCSMLALSSLSLPLPLIFKLMSNILINSPIYTT